jgi:hypothetical protein
MSAITKENGFGFALVGLDPGEHAFLTDDSSIVIATHSDDGLHLYVAETCGRPGLAEDGYCDLAEHCACAGMPVAQCTLSKADAIALAHAILREANG